MYIILKLKLKSVLKTFTKETTRAIKIMILGFILISAMLIIKYKPVYEVRLLNESIGYIKDSKNFAKTIEEQIINQEGENIDNISLKEEPIYELKLIARNKETNENQILEKLKNDSITTYKFYTVALNNKTVQEKYTDNKKEVKTDSVKIAQKQVEKTVDQLLEKKEADEALAVINGINVAVLPVNGRISSRFGVSSSIRSSRHTGLDIACSAGTGIKVVAKGTVTHAAYSGSYGNLIKVDHGKGVSTWYAHCSKIYVKKGQKVSTGDVIGAVGTTGNSTGPHLHLEIRINGTAVNPQRYLY